MKLVRRFLLFTLLQLLPMSSDAKDWMRYCNERFGQCADIPPGFVSRSEPANSDGLRFLSPDGAVLTVSAGYNATQDTTETTKISWIRSLGKPQYQAGGKNWFALSGWNGNRIYYMKAYVYPNLVSTLLIEYPSEHNSKYSNIISRLESSFKPAFQK